VPDRTHQQSVRDKFNMKKRSSATTTLYIKNMVCNRCIRVVREELEKLGLRIGRIELGEVDLVHAKSVDFKKIKSALEQNGFQLIEDKRARIIERIKLAILKLVQHNYGESQLRLNHSEYISKVLDLDYHSLSSLFSSIESVTIEQYIILQKIERVKELLKYGELTLSEIAFRMGYSSVQHLSNQFKRITGLTPSHFKDLKETLRKPLDKVSAT
jgi:AraC family transcriptional regulator